MSYVRRGSGRGRRSCSSCLLPLPPPLRPLPRLFRLVILVVTFLVALAVTLAVDLADAARGCCCSLMPF